MPWKPRCCTRLVSNQYHCYQNIHSLHAFKKLFILTQTESPKHPNHPWIRSRPFAHYFLNILQKGKCPAWGQKCSGCGSRNHFRSVCKRSKSREVHRISEMAEEPSSEESHIAFLAEVALDSLETDVHAVQFAKKFMLRC